MTFGFYQCSLQNCCAAGMKTAPALPLNTMPNCFCVSHFTCLLSLSELLVAKPNFEPEVRDVNGLLGFPVLLECGIPSHSRGARLNQFLGQRQVFSDFQVAFQQILHYTWGPADHLELSSEDAYSSYSVPDAKSSHERDGHEFGWERFCWEVGCCKIFMSFYSCNCFATKNVMTFAL